SFGVPICFLKSAMWGDCFHMERYSKKIKLFCHDPGELIQLIKDYEGGGDERILKNIRDDFIGSGNGVQWIVEKCRD
ncbi:hypothetical protein OAK75_13520, partial [Bacteriovoracales bacterium]|nr:hypothetical protein [Bacteriovoracales bacterium]